MVGFDEYDRKARLTPGLLGVLPLALLAITLGWKQYPVVGVATGVVGGAGAAYLLAILVRHFGRKIEAGLWASWGGAPTTAALRTRAESENPVERDQWRSAAQRLTGITLLTPPEETADPTRADQTITAAVSQLTPLGQSPAYPLVKAENIQYGFERNYYGIRWIGRTLSFLSVVIVLIVLVSGPRHLGDSGVSSAALVAGAVIDALFLLSWFVLPSKKRTRLAADRYSRQLYQAAVIESRNAPQGSRP